VTTSTLSLTAQISITLAGALVAIVATVWLRSRTLAALELALRSRERSEWAYAIAFWALAILLGVTYNAFGLIPLRANVPLTTGSTLTVLGLIWPPYMRDPTFTSTQRLVHRAASIAVGVSLLVLGTGHTG
jgi:hypothetical protein